MKKVLFLLFIIMLAGCAQIIIIPEEQKQENLRIKWIGQAGFMIESGGQRIYVDPYAASTELLKGDAIFITHTDFDHCDQASVNQLLKQGGIVFTTLSCGMKLGLDDFMTVEPEEEYLFNNFNVKTVHAYSLTDKPHQKGEGVGYIFEVGGYRIYHAGDTELIPELDDLGRIDIAILPISTEEYSMSLNDATIAARQIKANYTIPMQFPDTRTAMAFKSGLPDLNVELLTDEDLVFYEE